MLKRLLGLVCVSTLLAGMVGLAYWSNPQAEAAGYGSAGGGIVAGGPLGTPSSGVATNLTGTANGLTAGAVTSKPKWLLTRAGSQQVISGTDAVVNMDTKTIDTATICDIVTNVGRCTPNVAGFYRLTCGLRIVATTGPALQGNLATVRIYKNGAQINGSVQILSAQVASLAAPVSTVEASVLVQMNGTTDFVECFASSASTSPLVDNSTSVDEFTGELAL